MNYAATQLALISACVIGCGGEQTEAASAEQALQAGPASPARICEVVEANVALPDEARETSGLARSARDPDLFWTHNDAGNEPVIFAIGADGRLVQRVGIAGAELVDWEDMEAAPCGEGACLYVGDIGDNDGDRERITIYRVEEPAATATEAGPADALHATFPDGPRDAEGLFADGSGGLYVVSKGRRDEIALYRYPPPQRPGETVTLERVRALFPEPEDERDRVTAATSTPDGRWVGIRTYRALYLYPTVALVGDDDVEPTVVDLSSLSEAQGESLVLADDGSVWVSSEGGGDDSPPRWSRLRCQYPDP